MRIVLRNADGSEDAREVAAAVVDFGEWQLELSPEREPLRLRLHAPAGPRAFCGFVVYHRCANTATLELRPTASDEGDGGTSTHRS